MFDKTGMQEKESTMAVSVRIEMSVMFGETRDAEQ